MNRNRQRLEKAGIAVGILRFLMGLLLTVLFYVVSVFVIVRAAGWMYHFSYQVFGNQVVDSVPGRSIKIEVGEEDTMADVAKTLKQQKVIVDDTSFQVRAILTKKEVTPGTYTVNSSQTYSEILDILGTVKK